MYVFSYNIHRYPYNFLKNPKLNSENETNKNPFRIHLHKVRSIILHLIRSTKWSNIYHFRMHPTFFFFIFTLRTTNPRPTPRISKTEGVALYYPVHFAPHFNCTRVKFKCQKSISLFATIVSIFGVIIFTVICLSVPSLMREMATKKFGTRRKWFIISNGCKNGFWRFFFVQHVLMLGFHK